MKILVIGAAGKSGRAVVEHALAAGHDVTAFVHNAEGYSPHSDVRVVEGDARDRSAVESAMHEQDAVIDTIGGKNPMKATTLKQIPPRLSLPRCRQAEFAASWSSQ